MNLLQMASNRVPAADDLIPVLIYVVIKVKHVVFVPEAIVSNVVFR